jgi:hypothetical protein
MEALEKNFHAMKKKGFFFTRPYNIKQIWCIYKRKKKISVMNVVNLHANGKEWFK